MFVSGYGHGCRMLSSHRNIDIKELGYFDLFLAGSYTGVLQSPARQIVERIKSVMQIRESSGGKTPYSWSGACMMDLIKTEGLGNGLFRGFSSVLLREVPQFAVYYPTYEYTKKLYSKVSRILYMMSGFIGFIVNRFNFTLHSYLVYRSTNDGTVFSWGYSRCDTVAAAHLLFRCN